MTALDVTRASRTAAARNGRRCAAPALEARRGSPAERLGERLAGHRPVTVFIGLLVLCYLLLAATLIAVGLLFTRVLLSPGLDSADEGVVDWFVGHRTHDRNDLSFLGSEVSGGIVIPIVIGGAALAFAVRRHWRIAGFVIAAIVLESATYRATVLFVDRERPDVPRLDQLPVDASFPSGHVAASIAVYSGLALLLTSRAPATYLRVAVWAVALALPLVVGLSRMYRGMHHPLDLAAGVLLGIAALMLAVFVARVTGVVARRRAADEVPVTAPVIHAGAQA